MSSTPNRAPQYKAVFMALDGEFVTDYHRDSIEGVWDAVANVGSRWVFYPLAFVTTDWGTSNPKIVSVPSGPFDSLKGKHLKAAQNFVRKNQELLEAMLA